MTLQNPEWILVLCTKAGTDFGIMHKSRNGFCYYAQKPERILLLCTKAGTDFAIMAWYVRSNEIIRFQIRHSYQVCP